jgi:flagellar basal body rod protein FlgG
MWRARTVDHTDDSRRQSISISPRPCDPGTAIGRFQVVDFGAAKAADGEGLQLLFGSGGCGCRGQECRGAPGYQEASNVRSVDGVLGLMVVSRMYETNMNVLPRGEYARAIMTAANR